MVAAWEHFTKPPVFDRTRLEPLTSLLETRCLAIEGIRRWGPSLQQRLANTLAITVQGCDSLSLLAGLDLAGVCASSGSACSVGSLEPSHVLDEPGGVAGGGHGFGSLLAGSGNHARGDPDDGGGAGGGRDPGS
ncbi:MAG: aminotransferase class V-fold PLP-dependent enzyme [Verrucomicrobia bacterium]|nr:aminotransferase class V-fold PLP-dependent enzyme [Verrucomicrobiota bacterium]